MRTQKPTTVGLVLGLICAMLGACGTDAADPAASDPPPSPSGPASALPDASVPPNAATPPDADAASDGAPNTAKSCFQDLAGAVTGPDYEQFTPTVPLHCAGTGHQTIKGIEKLVFLGDSVTAGTPPTLSSHYYRNVLTEELKKTFGALEVSSCAAWGATTRDFLEGKKQLEACFPNATEPKKTLVVMTMGGNDIAGWRKAKPTTAAAEAEADAAAGRLRAAITWLKDPVRFPSGSSVVFGNVYEYTDTSGDLGSCPVAALGGISGTWPEGKPAVVHLQEQLMKVAVETKTDMVFLLEHFCGHGYKRNDATLQCYRGPNAEMFFDLTCIHPTPIGHAEIAKLFATVIKG